MIRTSYFARVISEPLLREWPVVVSANVPGYFREIPYTHAPLLAPTWELISDYKSGRCDIDQYIDRYFDLVCKQRKLSAKKIVDIIGDNATLVCYEKVGDFCHRHLISDIINRSTLGICVAEATKTGDPAVDAWTSNIQHKLRLRSLLTDRPIQL